MKALIYLFLCVSLIYGWPQRTVETYNEPLGDLSGFDYPEEGIYEPFIDDGLLETYGTSPDAVEGEGGPGPGGEGDIVIEDDLPDVAVPDTIVFNQSPLNPTLTYGYKRRDPFENHGSPFSTIFRTRPSRRPSILDHVFSRDWMRPVHRPAVDSFPSFHFRIGPQPRPSFRIPEIFSFQFPREEMIPQTFDSNIPWEEESANPGTDKDPNFFENDHDGTHNSHHDHHHQHPGHFLHNFFRPMSSFGGFDSTFGSFPDLPPNYSNSTSTVKEVNGTKIRVNETIHKKSGDNFNTFFHFKVIHAHPEMEEEEGTTLSPEEDVFQLEDVPDNDVILPDDETVIYDEITEEPIKYVPSEETTPVTSVADPEFNEPILPSFDVDFRENEIFNDEGMDEGNSNNVYHEISPKVGINY